MEFTTPLRESDNISHAPRTKETHTSMNNILVDLGYKKYQWEVRGDYKVIAVLLGLQAVSTKYSSFLCGWDSRARGTYYSRKHWPHRQSFKPGIKNCIHKPLLKPSKVHERFGSWTIRFTNKFSENKASRMTYCVSSYEHASLQHLGAISREYQRWQYS